MSAPPLRAVELDGVLEGMGDAIEAYRGKRVFVTGGTGFFGRWLLESLSHANRRAGLQLKVVVLTRDPAAFVARAPHLGNDPAIELHPGDLRSFTPPAGAFDYVLHAAASSDARSYATDPLGMLDTLITGTRRVVEFATARGVERLLFVSSGAVYGTQPPDLERIAEDSTGAPDPLQIGSIYAHGKRVAEHICALAAERGSLAIPIARCFAFVGPHLPLDAHFAIGNFIRDALAGGPIRVAGDGTPYRSYLYASDMACWLLTMLVRGQSRRAYNVGSGEPIRIDALAREVALQVGAEVVVARAPVEGVRPARYVPDVTRAQRELCLCVRVPLPAAIAATLVYHRAT